MMHIYCFKALDKTMKSTLQTQKSFDGKIVVLEGDLDKFYPLFEKHLDKAYCLCYNQFISLMETLSGYVFA